MVKKMETQARCLARSLRFFIVFMVFVYSFLSHTREAFAHTIVQGWEDHSASHAGLFLEPRINLYSTKQNYDLSGTQTPLTSNGSITHTYFDLLGTYGFTDDIFVYGRVSLLSTRATSTLYSSGGGNAFGFSDQLVGMAYRFWKNDSGSNITAQAEATIPAYNNANQKATGNPYLGDGSVDISVGGFGEFALPIEKQNDYFISVGGAFTKRSYGYSSAIPWSVFLKRDPITGFYFAAGTRGQVSLETDHTSLASATVDQNVGAAGSYLINGVNPSWLLADASIGYRLAAGHLLYVRGATPLYAKNSPSGFQVTAGAQFDLSPSQNSLNELEPPRHEKITTTVRNPKFSSYDLESKVTSTNDQLYLLKIDKGKHDGVERGQVFDIFKIEQDPVTQKVIEKRVAQAKVTHVKGDESALTVVEYFIESWIEVGFAAKRLVK